MFNAKELDEETGMYYYSARYYNPPTFISRDVLFEKKPFMSPYAMSRNNPLRFIDPSGMDEYEFDKRGHLKNTIENKDADIIRIVNRRGKEISSKSYGYGTVVTSRELYGGKGQGLMLKDNASRKDVFEFLADNTKVEWGSINAINSIGLEENWVATNHEKGEDNISTMILNQMQSNGYTVNEQVHSHPYDIFQYSNAPSGYGIDREKIPAHGGDKNIHNTYTAIWPNMNIKVYDAGSGNYYILGPTKESIKMENKAGKSMPTKFF
jgi:RHS repeat-associated protein